MLVEYGLVTTHTVLQVQLNGVTHTVARNHTGLESENLSLLNHISCTVYAGHHSIDIVTICLLLQAQLAHQAEEGRILTLIPVLETHDKHTVGRALTRNQAVTRHLCIGFNLGLSLQDLLHLGQHFVGLLQRSTRRTADVHHQYALVLLRHQTRLGGSHEVAEQHHCAYQ